MPLLLARILRVPYAVVGQTIGPLRKLQSFYRWIFNGAQSVTCRDAESLARVSDLGVKSAQLTADVAFLLERGNQGGGCCLPGFERFASGRPLVGVTPSNLHNVRSTADRARIMEALVEGCREMIEHADARILIIPTVFGPGTSYDDREAARQLAAAFSAERLWSAVCRWARAN